MVVVLTYECRKIFCIFRWIFGQIFSLYEGIIEHNKNTDLYSGILKHMVLALLNCREGFMTLHNSKNTNLCTTLHVGANQATSCFLT